MDGITIFALVLQWLPILPEYNSLWKSDDKGKESFSFQNMHITPSHRLRSKCIPFKIYVFTFDPENFDPKIKKNKISKNNIHEYTNELAPIIDVYVWFNQLIDWNWTRKERKKTSTKRKNCLSCNVQQDDWDNEK